MQMELCHTTPWISLCNRKENRQIYKESHSIYDIGSQETYTFFKLHIIQLILHIQLYTSLILGSAQLASLLITLKTKYGNNYREKYKIE